MTIIGRFAVTTAALAFAFVGVSGAFAQEPKPSPNPAPAPQLRPMQAAPASTIQGELMKVDTTAKTLVVKTADGKEEQFTYTDATKVTGAQSGIAGLANTTRTQVTVKFTGTGTNRVATEVSVHEAKS
jgi:hypothetical protein